jgi:uncharacterized membrane protein
MNAGMKMNNKFQSLMKSRKFWMAIVSLVLLVFGNFAVPDFNVEETLAIVVPVIVYMAGTAIEAVEGFDPAEYEDKFKFMLKSRKFWVLVVSLVFAGINVFAPEFPITEDLILEILAVLNGYSIFTAVEDSKVRG